MLLQALFILFYAGWNSSSAQQADEHEAINLHVLRDQSRELINDVEHGTLAKTDYLTTQRELDIRAAQILSTDPINPERDLNPRWTI